MLNIFPFSSHFVPHRTLERYVIGGISLRLHQGQHTHKFLFIACSLPKCTLLSHPGVPLSYITQIATSTHHIFQLTYTPYSQWCVRSFKQPCFRSAVGRMRNAKSTPLVLPSLSWWDLQAHYFFAV